MCRYRPGRMAPMSSFIFQRSACLKHMLALHTSLLDVGGLTCLIAWNWRMSIRLLMLWFL